MSVSYGPMGGIFSSDAALPKIWPIGALLKYSLVLFCTDGSCAATCEDGQKPCEFHMVSCCCGAVSHSARAIAACSCGPPFATPSHEPPQLAEPPGSDVTSHLPLPASPA